MRYWVYINDKVEGPHDEDKLVTLQGFTPETLICSEEVAAGGSQEWVKASSIFEFDQIEKTLNQPMPEALATATMQQPAVTATQAPVAQEPAPTANPVANNDLAALLLAKLDSLTSQITGLQTKLDGMQSKLDEAVNEAHEARLAATAAQASQVPSDVPAYMPPSDLEDRNNTITLTRHDIEPEAEEETENEEASITNTESLVSKAEDIVAAANKEEPLDMLGDLALEEESKDANAEESLGSNPEEEVLRSALDSLYGAQAIQTQEEKESTFQDLLTPKQAAELAALADAKQAKEEKTLDEALKETEPAKEETPSVDEAAKDALLAELTASPKEDVLDQVIREKEEEKKGDTLKVAALSAAAGVAAAAGIASLMGDDKEEEEEKAEEVPAEEPVAEKQPLDLEETADAPVLSIATDAAEPEKLEEVLPADQMPEDVPAAPEAETVEAEPSAVPELPAEETQEEQPQAEPVAEPQAVELEPVASPEPAAEPVAEPEAVELEPVAAPEPAEEPVQEPEPVEEPVAAPAESLPSLDQSDPSAVAQQIKEDEQKDATFQELVPNAPAEKPEGSLITEDDLNDAFAERETEDQNVEQLFGLDQQNQETQTNEAVDTSVPVASLPTFDEQTSDQPLPVGNPNDLTEIELKEGSTYLISDFVPPAQADGNALPKELGALASEQTSTLNTKAAEPAQEEMGTEIQEIVSSTKQTEKMVETSQLDVADGVTISQVILENTIKTKRGATLDIKTVPMVPEPAQSERLHLDDLADDINTQHDVKPADIKPASGKTKAIVGGAVAVVALGLIYAMLGFMNLLPASINVFGDKQAAAQQAQQAQMDEMLVDENTYQQDPSALLDAAPVDPTTVVLQEVQAFPLMNGYTLKEFIEAKHPAAVNLITWEISTAVDPDNYSVIVKVPPENPQSFKTSYRFNYNAVTKALDPTISDAKNLLDSAAQGVPATQAPLQ